MLQNAYFLAKIGADTAENEQHFAEILPTDALWRRKTKDVVHQLPVRPCPSQLPDALSHEHSLDHAGVKESIRRSFREASIFLIDELEGLSTRTLGSERLTKFEYAVILLRFF